MCSLSLIIRKIENNNNVTSLYTSEVYIIKKIKNSKCVTEKIFLMQWDYNLSTMIKVWRFLKKIN